MVDKPNGTAALADPEKGAAAAPAEGAEPVAPPIPDGRTKEKEKQESETPEQIAERLVAENRRLKGERDAERRGRQDAEARAAASTNTAFAQAEEKVSTGLKAAKEKREQLQRDYETAATNADFKRMAELSIEIGDTAVDLRNWEFQRQQLDQAKTRVTEAKVDLNEQVINSLTKPAQRWIRAHPEYIRDGVLDFKMQAAHYKALGEGVEQDSDDYFRFIEGELGLSAGGSTREPPARSETPRAPARAASSVAAPPSRDTGGGRQVQPERVEDVTLSALEQEQAETEHPELKPHEAHARYASNKLALLREGAYERGARR